MGMLLRMADDIPNDSHIRKIVDTLSQYTKRVILGDGSMILSPVHDNRFYRNAQWGLALFRDIPQFRKSADLVKYGENRSISFAFPHEDLNLEAKLIVYHKIFDEEWSLSNLFGNQINYLLLAAKFIGECYPHLISFLDLNMDTIASEWVSWLEQRGAPIMTTSNENEYQLARRGRHYQHKTYIALYLPNLCKWLHKYLDDREEWDKDGWDVRNLEKYGVLHNKTALSYYMYFDYITNPMFRKYTKEYIKQKLLNKTFAWHTAKMYMSYLPMFFNEISEMEPDWTDLKALERRHIIRYIAWLDEYLRARPASRKDNPAQYKNRALTVAHKFLSDMQLYENEVAPVRDIRTLIFPEDKPKMPQKAYDKTDYIPDFVLDQLFENINALHPDAVPVIWIMYKTGLRISDALLLKQDCLFKLEGKYWVEADIKKTYVKGHRVPIDDQLASIIATLIDLSRKNSNEYNNPDSFIFARLSGSRRGKPIGQYLIREYLNDLAHIKNIVDESGTRYHFTNHAFRHTYAVKLLNGGADIITIQELLAHASPEMTMRYARLLDDNKRKAFDKVVEQGLFSFGENDRLVRADCAKVPRNILDMLWTNHKLNAVDTPYGTCLQRSKGKCTFAKQPPCLTCNAGKPCKDLCVGAVDGDIEKYQVLITSTSALIEQAKRYGRSTMVQENEELLAVYQDVYDTISGGNLIYSRIDRLG